MQRTLWILLALALTSAPALAEQLTAQAVNDAEWQQAKPAQSAISPAMVKLQVLLDRARFSPGEIDGKPGENVEKAIAAFAAAQGADASGGMTDELWQKLVADAREPIVRDHRITEADVKGPFLKKLPARMEAMKSLPALSYTSPRERLAEQFHMSPELLAALNPGQKFDKPGDSIVVANVGSGELPEKATRLEVDKATQTLKVFGKSDKPLAVYPVTVGSEEKPAPEGVLKVTSIARHPTYRYNPDYAFKGVKSRKPFTIKPGPNNPVGVVWIGLSKEGYGIHGTPEPAKVSKTASHGCIRLTNWDALTLASATSKGIAVEFTAGENQASAAGGGANAKPKGR
jgi:lipoprotein-anchoring transpeptidase ErfK/SrfK